MLIIRQLTTPMRMSFRLPQANTATHSVSRWENYIFSTSAIFACFGLGLSSYALRKLIATTSTEQWEHVRKWGHHH